MMRPPSLTSLIVGLCGLMGQASPRMPDLSDPLDAEDNTRGWRMIGGLAAAGAIISAVLFALKMVH